MELLKRYLFSNLSHTSKTYHEIYPTLVANRFNNLRDHKKWWLTFDPSMPNKNFIAFNTLLLFTNYACLAVTRKCSEKFTLFYEKYRKLHWFSLPTRKLNQNMSHWTELTIFPQPHKFKAAASTESKITSR